jgi:2-keto-4-pentenoate hydratase/2-oxohepta-3-ene-1,7-dioic acid hydratase in catechol pathway
MKLVTFAARAGQERLGVLGRAGVVDVAAASKARGTGGAGRFRDVLSLLEAGDEGFAQAGQIADWALDRPDGPFVLAAEDIRLLASVPRPPKVLCMAGNYSEHWREGGLA